MSVDVSEFSLRRWIVASVGMCTIHVGRALGVMTAEWTCRTQMERQPMHPVAVRPRRNVSRFGCTSSLRSDATVSFVLATLLFLTRGHPADVVTYDTSPALFAVSDLHARRTKKKKPKRKLGKECSTAMHLQQGRRLLALANFSPVHFVCALSFGASLQASTCNQRRSS